jgi:hypothetical protein
LLGYLVRPYDLRRLLSSVASSTQNGLLEGFNAFDLVFNLDFYEADLLLDEVAHLGAHVTEVLQCLVLLGVVEPLHAAHVITHIEHLGLCVVGLHVHLLLDLLDVVVELLEGIGRCCLVLLYVGLQ